MSGIEKTLESFKDLGDLSVDLIGIFKAGGFSLGSLPKMVDAISKVGELAIEVQAVMPELADLDVSEAGQVGAAAYAFVKKVMSALG